VIKVQEIEKRDVQIYTKFAENGPRLYLRVSFLAKISWGKPPRTPHGRAPISLHTLLEWCACLAVAAYFMDRTCYSETYGQPWIRQFK